MAKKKRVRKTKEESFALMPSKWVIPMLAGLGLALYLNTLGHDYALDDAMVITENQLVQQGIAGIPEIFSHDSFFGFFNEQGKDQLVSGGRYRPLTLGLFAIEKSLFGSNPFWGHLFNLLWYTLTVVLLFLVVRRTLDPPMGKVKSLFLATTTALIFAIHPIHTEVVANIKSRDEIMALLLGLLAAIAVLNHLEKPKWKFALLAGTAFLLALLAKEIAVSFLAIIPLMIYFFRSTSFSVILRSASPLILSFLLYLLLRISIVGLNLGGEPPTELMNNPFMITEGTSYRLMTPSEKAPMLVYGLGKYLQMSFLPFPLTHDYYPRHIPVYTWQVPKVIASLILVLGLVAFAIYGLIRSNRSIPVFCTIFFFASIFLVSNILFPIGTNLGERFLFIPSVAACLIIAQASYLLYKRFGRKVGVAAILLVGLGYSLHTIARTPAWTDNFTLFTTDVKTSANSAKVRNATGGELIARSHQESDTTRAREMLEEAIQHLTKAVEIHPRYKNAYLLLGNAYYYKKDYQEAIRRYDMALALDGNYKDALQNRAVSWRDLGRRYGEELGDIEQAIANFEKALPFLDDDYELNRLLGVAYGNRGDVEQAIHYFNRAGEIRPDEAWIHYNLGIAYLTIGDTTKANSHMIRAKELNPEVGR
ncbi:MAG: tetratricopeptide repeat protein [Saprospiraceae bacterium]|nr:tetratricopeptide repeat protein [Saprospiraceae bacterium]